MVYACVYIYEERMRLANILNLSREQKIHLQKSTNKYNADNIAFIVISVPF